MQRFLTTLLPFALFVSSSCAQMKNSMKSGSRQEALKAMDTVDVPIVESREETNDDDHDTHALVDAQGADNEIVSRVGENIDKELPENEAPKVEESPSFLKKVSTKRVQYWINYFTVEQRERFQRFINNGEKYRPVIEKILSENDLPIELYYVGLIESGYYLGAHSKASAVGPWQFIRGTGSRYGMVMNNDIDERRDIFKATSAAANYFRDLHNIFSSWELALAAYNAGEYGIIRRITKHKTRDYYEMSRNKYLPSETINYVPKVIAAMHVVQNANKYGFTRPTRGQAMWLKTKKVLAPKGTTLQTLSRRLGVSVGTLTTLNPELKGNRTPSRYPGSYTIRVPVSLKHTAQFEDIAIAETKTVSVQRNDIEVVVKKPTIHRVRRGETLSLIAARNHMSLKRLALMNNMTVKTRVKVGQLVRLTASDETRTVVQAAPKRVTPKRTVVKKPLQYVVNRGETLTDIARMFALTVNDLKEANEINRGRRLQAGQRIVLPNTHKGTYVVRRGDYLLKIADKYNLSKHAIMRLNRLKSANVFVGQRLLVNVR